MDAFTYTDIFDTKGIEYIIIIAFLLLLIPFWNALNRPLKSRVRAKDFRGVLSENILSIPLGLLYGKNHTWAHLERAGLARIGLDDLLLHITGRITIKDIRNKGEKISRGDTLAQIEQDGKTLKIESPVSGEIIRVNSALIKNPEDLNSDPYGKGWLVKIQPENWKAETSSYYLADKATDWIKKEMIRFKDFIAVSQKKYSPESSLVILQEGGELRDYPLEDMSKDVWEEFQAEFLKTLK